jgi:very-short-patch-repair endonuclease
VEQRTFARQLRANPTDAERRLWSAISARKVAGVRFNRQVSIGPFVCDFVARGPRIVLEVDGGQHDVQAEADRDRTRFLEEQGFRVLRFWNHDVLGNLDGVIARLEQALCDLPSPNPSRAAGGE